MRRFLIAGVLLGVVVVSLAACGDSSSDSETAGLQLKADTYEIGRIEEQFHQAMTLKDIDQMMSLWAPNATLTVGPDLTAAGLDEIRQFWLTKSVAFAPETTWVSDHPAYKLAVTVTATGHAALRVPFRGLRERPGGGGHGRRPGRVADRRTLVDHQLHRGIDRVGPLSRVRNWGRETPRGGRRRAAPADEPGRLPARPGRGPLASPGSHETAHRLRGHGGPPGRGRCPRATRPRAIGRPGERARAAPATSRRLRQAPERHRERPPSPPREPFPGRRFLHGVARRSRDPSQRGRSSRGRPGGREPGEADRTGDLPRPAGIRASCRGRERPR